MTESQTDKTLKTIDVESATKEFSEVVDATGSFIKKIFPYGYTLIEKLKGKKKVPSMLKLHEEKEQ
ncbi:unnamed protein product [marine sediment metagenome]|uniref:Uncharacterized protein n=1 Tax=marine sediment metagenome TaxID=412755 RepID=X0SVT4_9ZZZZ